MKNTKQTESFPYRMNAICYFEVYKDGKVLQVHHKNKSDINEISEAYQRARNNITTLYAVWPGNWSSDLFIIDDLDAFSNSFNL